MSTPQFRAAALAAIALSVTAGQLQAQVASALLREGQPLGGPGYTIFSLNNPQTNNVGGYSVQVNTRDTGGGGGPDLSNIWGNASGGPGSILLTESSYPFGEFTLVQTAFESFSGFSNAGQSAISATGTGGPVDGFDSVWLDAIPIAVEGAQLPPPLDTKFWSFASRPTVTGNGTVYFAGGTRDTQNGGTTARGLFDGNGQAIAYSGDLLPNLPAILDFGGSAIAFGFRFSGNGTNWIAEALMETTGTGLATSNDEAVVINGVGLMLDGVLLREDNPVPASIGGLPGETWSSVDQTVINEAGEYLITGNTADGGTTTDEFVILTGQIVLREGDFIGPDQIAGAIEAGDLNENGDWAVVWDLEAGTADPEALIVNGIVVLREGDIVDLDGDGIAEPNSHLVDFTGIDSLAMSDRDASGVVRVYFNADIDINGTSSSTDDIEALMVFAVQVGPPNPIGACCRGEGACTMGTASECLQYVCDVTALSGATCFGDADGNGVVNSADRGFVSANIGRTEFDLICQFDLDGNGTINSADRGFISANIGLCSDLPDYQNGSGLKDGLPDSRFPSSGVFLGAGTECSTAVCPEYDRLASSAVLLVSIPPGAPPMPITLDSNSAGDTVVSRRDMPYTTGQNIPTEMVQLDLRAAVSPVGPVMLFEDPQLRSPGAVTSVQADQFGRFLSGNSSFDIFVRAYLPQLGLTVDTGGIPIRMESQGINALPPLGAVFSTPPTVTYGLFADGVLVGTLLSVTHELRNCDCPDDGDFGRWNDDAGNRKNNNCYNYATNQRTNTFAQPGRENGAQAAEMSCAAVQAAAIADGAMAIAGPGPCPADKCLVALVVAPGEDYHWYRYNDDGTWTHKPGETEATSEDSSGAAIADPRTADRRFKNDDGTFDPGYTDFCSFMCVAWDIAVSRSEDDLRGSSLARVSILNSAGLENPGWAITTELDLLEIESRLAGLVPTADPGWTSTLGFSGIAVYRETDPDFPQAVRVWDGVIEIGEGTSRSYYLDSNGLDTYLRSQAVAMGLGDEL